MAHAGYGACTQPMRAHPVEACRGMTKVNMPTLTAPPEIELPAVSFFGRSLDEYAQFFALDVAALRGRAVLDVAAGPSSFTAEACRRGVDAVAVDPMYGKPPAALATHVDLDYSKMFAQMRAKRRLFRVGAAAFARRGSGGGLSTRARPRPYFPSFDHAETDRRAAAQRFLIDYETHFVHGRYIGAALPRLPFLDGAFELVLCAHLLFTYARHFDFEWHLTACRELARVSTGEVRIHPICGPDGRRYGDIGRLQHELLAGGVTSKVVAVPYEFFVGSSSMLVLNPAPATAEVDHRTTRFRPSLMAR